MRNQDKDIKQKVAEYMEIMGIYAPEKQEEPAAAEEKTDTFRIDQAGRNIEE